MRLRFTTLCLSATLLFSSSLRAQFISTFAGNGSAGYSGDGSPCTEAQLSSCSAVAFDGAGNVYIADMGNNVVRKVSTSGIISTLAGTGVAGYGGDGSLAVSAKLNAPSGVAVDVAGNVYISDNGNNVIRKVQTNGIISTYAGKGSAGFSGDGGAATAARLSSPQGIAVDGSGNLYIADGGNNAVREVYASGVITTLAGGGAAGYSGDGSYANFASLSSPSAVAVDPRGQVYIADNINQVVRLIDTSYVMHTFAGTGYPGSYGNGGPATAAELFFPTGVSVYGFGDVYIADQGNNVVRHVNSAGIISTFAGNGSSGYFGDGGYATSAELRTPRSVAADGDNRVFIADQSNNVIRIVSAQVKVNTVTAAAPACRVYPNPAMGTCSLDIPARPEACTVTFMDLLGRTVSETNLDAATQTTTLRFTPATPGTYLIKVDAKESTWRDKVLVW